ncbi:MAG: PEP-CTERM sorting domain-containing protein [Desulfobacterales bacterium]|jgi:hypothetical protein
MESIVVVLCVAILTIASPWMNPAGAESDMFVPNEQNQGLTENFNDLVFEDPLNEVLLDWGPISAAGNPVGAVFEQTAIHFGGSAMREENAPFSVPEPASMFLLGSGLIAIAGIGRKKLLNKKKGLRSPQAGSLKAGKIRR